MPTQNYDPEILDRAFIAEIGKHVNIYYITLREVVEESFVLNSFIRKTPLLEFLNDEKANQRICLSLYGHYIDYCSRIQCIPADVCAVKTYSWIPFCLIRYIEENTNIDKDHKEAIYILLFEISMTMIFDMYKNTYGFTPSMAWKKELMRLMRDAAKSIIEKTFPEDIEIFDGIKYRRTFLNKISNYVIFHAFNNFDLYEKTKKQSEKITLLEEEIETKKKEIKNLSSQNPGTEDPDF